MAQGARLARKLGTFDIALIVMGSVIGSGIFRTPSVVAQRAPDAVLILAAWSAGGIVALCGAFVLGELAARRPDECGLYAHLRDAFHPFVGFAFGWAALLGMYSAGLSAAAILFAGYFLSLTNLPAAPGIVAALTLGSLALLNTFGVRQGATVQNALTVLKIAALLAVVAAGLLAAPAAHAEPQSVWSSAFDNANTLKIFGIALIPVLFSYSGAQVANFVATETKGAARALPLGLTLGMIAVTAIYVLVNIACVRSLGTELAKTDVPVAAVIARVAGSLGTRLASLAIAVTTLGYMSNRTLTVPRLYHAMAADGLFFRAIDWLDPRRRVPTVAVILQAAVAIVISLSAGYSHILNFSVASVYGFGGLLGVAIFVFRARDRRAGFGRGEGFRIPLHPFSTMLFVLAAWGVTVATCIAYPRDGLLALAVIFSGIPAYFVWTRGRIVQKARA